MATRRTFLQSSAAAAAFLASGAWAARAANAPGVTATEIKIGQTMPYSGASLGLRHHRQDGGRLFSHGQ
jgi:branched-chain amino acid transport system substrate-binding protein